MKRILLGLLLFALSINPVPVYAEKTFSFELGGEDWHHGTIAPGELLEDKVIVENATGYPLKFRLIRTENLNDSELYDVMKYSMDDSDYMDLADITSGWIPVAVGETAEIPVVGYMPETLGNEWQGKKLNARFYFEGRMLEESDMYYASYQDSIYGLQDSNLKDLTGEIHFSDSFLFDTGVDLSKMLVLESVGLYTADGTLVKRFVGVSQEEGWTGAGGYFYNFPITAEELKGIIDNEDFLGETDDFYIQKTYSVISDFEVIWTAESNQLAEWTENGGIIKYPFTYTRALKPDKPVEPEKPDVLDKFVEPAEPEAPATPDVWKVSGEKGIHGGSGDYVTQKIRITVERTSGGVVVKAVKTGDTENIYGFTVMLVTSVEVLVYYARCKYKDSKKGRNAVKEST